jgi:hypothetical protein
MNAQDLPYKLSAADLPKVEIMHSFVSMKTGAGRQEIYILGTGQVRLLFSGTAKENPDVREGKLAPDLVIRLLDFIEGQGLAGLEEHYPASHNPHARRIVRLTLPGMIKTVMVDEPKNLEFERIVGAVKYAAGIALPDALNNRFFPNL